MDISLDVCKDELLSVHYDTFFKIPKFQVLSVNLTIFTNNYFVLCNWNPL